MSSFNESNVVMISEKLAQATANVEKVFKTGLDEGYRNGYKNAFEMGGYTEGYETAKQEANETFWNNVTNNGNRTNYRCAFNYWSNEYIRPNRKIIPIDANSAADVFFGCKNLKKVEADYFDFSQKKGGDKATNSYHYTFFGCSSLKEIEDIGLIADWGYEYTFSGDVNLRKIARLGVNVNTTFNKTFENCKALEEVYFDGRIGQNIDLRWSTKLIRDCLEDIVIRLAQEAEGKVLTLSETAVNTAFGDDWDDYVATFKPLAWTITLV